MTELNEFITNPEDCESIMSYSFEQTKQIYKENQRLKDKLDDYENALKEYADMSNWFVCYLRHHFIFQKDNYKANELAKETLKKWEK